MELRFFLIGMYLLYVTKGEKSSTLTGEKQTTVCQGYSGFWWGQHCLQVLCEVTADVAAECDQEV